MGNGRYYTLILLFISFASFGQTTIGAGETLNVATIQRVVDTSTLREAFGVISFNQMGLIEGGASVSEINTNEAYNRPILQTYIDSFEAWNLEHIYANKGTYYFDTTLVIRGRVKIIGQSIAPTGAETRLRFIHSDCGIHALPGSHIDLEGLTLNSASIPNGTYGSVGQDTTRDQSGLFIQGSYKLKDLYISYFADHGVHIDTRDSLGGYAERIHVRRCGANIDTNNVKSFHGFYRTANDTTFPVLIGIDVNYCLSDSSWGYRDESKYGSVNIAAHNAGNRYPYYSKSTYGQMGVFFNPYLESSTTDSHIDSTNIFIEGLHVGGYSSEPLRINETTWNTKFP